MPKMDELEAAGVDASGINLPKIVVVGDQSAGKSSLIEAISGINVPRVRLVTAQSISIL